SRRIRPTATAGTWGSPICHPPPSPSANITAKNAATASTSDARNGTQSKIVIKKVSAHCSQPRRLNISRRQRAMAQPHPIPHKTTLATPPDEPHAKPECEYRIADRQHTTSLQPGKVADHHPHHTHQQIPSLRPNYPRLDAPLPDPRAPTWQ